MCRGIAVADGRQAVVPSRHAPRYPILTMCPRGPAGGWGSVPRGMRWSGAPKPSIPRAGGGVTDLLQAYAGKAVIVTTVGRIYLGRLVGYDPSHLLLEDA